jgi:hypothetical protein
MILVDLRRYFVHKLLINPWFIRAYFSNVTMMERLFGENLTVMHDSIVKELARILSLDLSRISGSAPISPEIKQYITPEITS